MSRRTLGLIFVLISVIAYGIFPILIKLAYAEGMQPLDLVFWRFVFAVGAIWLSAPLWWKQAGIAKLRGARLIDPLWLGWMFALPALLAALALDRVQVTTYTLILYSYPAVVALGSALLGRLLGWHGWLAAGVATLGCALTIGGRAHFNGPLDVILPLLDAMSIAVFMLIAEAKADSVRGLSFSILNMTAALAFITPVAVWAGIDLPATPAAWWLMLAIGIFCTVLPIITLMNGISLLGATETSVITTLEPVVAITMAVMLLREAALPLQLLGGALILSSLLLLQLPAVMARIPKMRWHADQPVG